MSNQLTPEDRSLLLHESPLVGGQALAIIDAQATALAGIRAHLAAVDRAQAADEDVDAFDVLDDIEAALALAGPGSEP